jgi:hypothetical protein
VSTLSRSHRSASVRLRLLVLVSLGLVSTLGACAESKPPAGQANEPTVAQGSASAAAGSCGKTGQPDCPLQSWMKATVQAYLKAGDAERLAAALDTLAEHEPNGYAGWQDAARRGAQAARSGDMLAAKAECKRCHDDHRSRFRAEQRATRLF